MSGLLLSSDSSWVSGIVLYIKADPYSVKDMRGFLCQYSDFSCFVQLAPFSLIFCPTNSTCPNLLKLDLFLLNSVKERSDSQGFFSWSLAWKLLEALIWGNHKAHIICFPSFRDQSLLYNIWKLSSHVFCPIFWLWINFATVNPSWAEVKVSGRLF